MAGLLTPRQRFKRWRKTFHRQNLPIEQIKTALGAIGIMAVCTVTLGAPLLRLADASLMAVLGVCSGGFSLSISAIYPSQGQAALGFFRVCCGILLHRASNRMERCTIGFG